MRVPALPLLGFGLYMGILALRDPTAGNLWPFVMAVLIALTGVLFGVFVIAQRSFGSDASKIAQRKR